MRLHNNNNKTNLRLQQRLSVFLLISLIVIIPAVGQTTDKRNLELVVQTGHSDFITSVAFSADGEYLASAERNQIVKLWDVKSGIEIRTFDRQFNEKLNSSFTKIKQGSDSRNFVYVAFSPDGKILASSGEGGIVAWKIETGERIAFVQSPSWTSGKIIFTGDGKTLICAAGDKITFLDLETKKPGKTVPFDSVTSIALSEDGKFLAGASLDVLKTGKTFVKIWDVKTGRLVRNLYGLDGMILSLSFSPNGKFLAAGSLTSEKIKVWNINTGGIIKSFEGANVHFIGDRFFVTAKLAPGEENIVFWKTENWQKLFTLPNFDGVSAVAFNLVDKFKVAFAGNRSTFLFTTEKWKYFSVSSSEIEAFSYNRTNDMLAVSNDFEIKLWDIAGKQTPITLSGHNYPVKSLAFSHKGDLIASGEKKYEEDKSIAEIKLWDSQSGKLRNTIKAHNSTVNTIAFDNKDQILASGAYREIKLWDVDKNVNLRTLLGFSGNINKISFSSNSLLAACDTEGNIKVWNLADKTAPKNFTFTLIGENSKRIAAETKKALKDYVGLNADQLNGAKALSFSPDEKKLAVGSMYGDVNVFDVSTGKLLFAAVPLGLDSKAERGGFLDDIIFSKDGKTIYCFSYDDIKALDAESGKEIPVDMKLIEHPNIIKKENSVLFVQSLRNTINIIDLNRKKDAAYLSFINDNDWVVTTPDGLFDGTPEAWKQIIWRFDNNTFNYAPVEAFFKEFYRPGLLQDIFAGNKIESPTQDLSKIDIRQPFVEITAIDGKAIDSSALSSDKKSVKVKVEITDNNSEPRPGIAKNTSSDAQDVRLFRNGSLVKLWNGNAFQLTEKDGCEQIPETEDSPRKAVCETDVQISAGKNELTAYGFNYQDVKSSDGLAVVNGAESLKRDGTLYVLAVGVNKYANADYNLNYAVKDVVEIGKTLQDNQAKLGNLKQYARTEIITLTDESATKENILRSLTLFSGGEKDAQLANVSDEVKTQLSKIAPVQPEDAVVIYFAGHGVSKGQRFYLLPHNFTGDAELLEQQSVSDLELNEYLEKVDAGKLLMVIDACQSGQALGGKNDGKAPMNSKGFAQLAYDKGMLILTAAQSQQAALEAVRIGDKTIENGLLTYALLQAFSNTQADKDGNKQLWEREWFDFAVGEVPLFQREAMRRREADLKNDPQAKGRSGIYYVNGDKKTNADERNVQTPRVFYRREPEIKPFILVSQ